MTGTSGDPSAPTGRLVGVGVGPGDPGLLTLRALEVLKAVDRVVAPSTAEDAVGRAEAIVRAALPGLSIDRLVFDMTPDRETSHRLAAERLAPLLRAGEDVAFVTLGDPNMYSTFSALCAALHELEPGVAVETVPGIMAFQELAARSGVVLLDGTEHLRLVTALDGTADLKEALADPDGAVVVYKGGRHLPAIASALDEAGRLEGAVFGELLGLPGERVAAVAEAASGPATYLATVIVPPARPRP